MGWGSRILPKVMVGLIGFREAVWKNQSWGIGENDQNVR